MHFNQMGGNPWSSFASFMGGFAAGQGSSWGNYGNRGDYGHHGDYGNYGDFGGFGGRGGMGGWMSGSMMRHSGGDLQRCWGGGSGWGGECGNGRHGRHHGMGGQQRSGRWDSENGGYVVGGSGQLDVSIKDAKSDYRNLIQYQTEGGNWQNVGYDEQTGKTQSIQARPGSTVKFRIDNGHGDYFQAGTTANADGIDHGKISKTATGTQIGFEDYYGDSKGDFGDAVIEVNDVNRPQAWVGLSAGR